MTTGLSTTTVPSRPALPVPRARAPELPASPGLSVELLLRALDEIDYALLLLGPAGQLRAANHRGWNECAQGPLCLVHGSVQARLPTDQQALAGALQHAARGRRTLLALGEFAPAAQVAVVPLPVTEAAPDAPSVLLVFARRGPCEALSMGFFSRQHGLTAAEDQVLRGLCEGLRPREIAQRHGVALSTVRTQVSAIRAKTGDASMATLVRRVAQLPPLTPAVKALAHEGRLTH